MVSGGRRFKKGTWTVEEDALLLAFVKEHGPASWNTAHLLFPNLLRSGKSCRLRYLNQLRPGIRRVSVTPEEECIILMAHSILGNQWSRIASMLPGRTDNCVKNVVNMRLKRARRHAASVNFARRTARILSEQQAYAPSLSGMNGSPEAYNHISLPSSACSVSALVLPPSQVAMVGMHGTWRCSASSPGACTALVTGRGAPQTYNPMLVSDSKAVAFTESTPVDAEPTSSYNEWVMQTLSGAEKLPSVQKPFESFQLPSVQEPLQSLEGSELPSVQAHSQSLSLGSELPSVQAHHPQVEMVYCSSNLIGSELPSVQAHHPQVEMVYCSSNLIGSELPSVQAQHPQVEMACHSSNRIVGDNDLLEAMKLTGYCSSSSSNSSAASSPPSPVSSFYFDDSYLNTLLTGMEAGGQQMSTVSSPTSSSESLHYDLSYLTSSMFDVSSSLQISKDQETAGSVFDNVSNPLQQLLGEEGHPGALICSLMNLGIDGELANMVLSNSAWSSMPGACNVGESASTDFMPDFN